MCGLTVVLSMLSLTSTERPATDHLSPQELLGESVAPSSVPLAAVSSYTKKLEAENQHLSRENTALRTESAVDEAKQAVAVAGGLMQPQSKTPTPAEKEATAVPPAAEMPAEMKKGMRVMDEFSAQNQKLEEELAKADAKANALQQNQAAEKIKHEEAVLKAKAESNIGPSTYHRIPFFKFDAGAKELEDIQEQGKCQDLCDKQIKCKSYSWSSSKRSCLWSVDAVHYDHKYLFLVKAQISTAGDPEAAWREFPGVKFITAHSNKKENVDFKQCKTICEVDVSCKSFSYRADTNFCSWSSNGMSYDKDYNYFEKDERSLNKIVESKQQKLKKAEDELKEKVKVHQEKEEKKQADEAKENELKKQERNRWIKNNPTTSQEAHLKTTVAMEMKGMDVKFALQNAQKKQEIAKEADDAMKKAQLATVSKLSGLEAELKKLSMEKKKAFAQLDPLENAKSMVEIAIAKIKSKLKILAVDRVLKEKAVENAEEAHEQALKSENTAAITSTTEQYNDAKRAITDNEDEKGKLVSDLAAQQAALNEKAAALRKAQDDEKKFKQQFKGEEAQNKDAVKEEKAMLHQEKLRITGDKEKAQSAQMVALKAKEKLAKSKRANAKVSIMKAEEDIKNVKTADDRREIEKRIADDRGALFKADKDNEDVTTPLIEVARKLAATKEILHKSKAKVVKAEATKERQDVQNKLEKLENENVQSPL